MLHPSLIDVEAEKRGKGCRGRGTPWEGRRRQKEEQKEENQAGRLPFVCVLTLAFLVLRLVLLHSTPLRGEGFISRPKHSC